MTDRPTDEQRAPPDAGAALPGVTEAVDVLDVGSGGVVIYDRRHHAAWIQSDSPVPVRR